MHVFGNQSVESLDLTLTSGIFEKNFYILFHLCIGNRNISLYHFIAELFFINSCGVFFCVQSSFQIQQYIIFMPFFAFSFTFYYSQFLSLNEINKCNITFTVENVEQKVCFSMVVFENASASFESAKQHSAIFNKIRA